MKTDAAKVETELVLTMAENIKLLSARIDEIEKTIETYGKLIDRLETKIYGQGGEE